MGIQPGDCLTIGETIEVLRRLDGLRGLDVSARQLRYWDRTFDLRAARATNGRNGARTFTKTDVAMIRLVRRLRRDDVSSRAIWALLLHRGSELRAACRPGISKVLWMEPDGRVHFLNAREAATKPARECYVLANVVRGIEETVRSLRAHDDAPWNGAKAVPVEELGNIASWRD